MLISHPFRRRRERDSNPRNGRTVYWFSRPASSTARASLHFAAPSGHHRRHHRRRHRGTIAAPLRSHRGTIAAPSGRHCGAIGAPSRRHRGTIRHHQRSQSGTLRYAAQGKSKRAEKSLQKRNEKSLRKHRHNPSQGTRRQKVCKDTNFFELFAKFEFGQKNIGTFLC